MRWLREAVLAMGMPIDYVAVCGHYEQGICLYSENVGGGYYYLEFNLYLSPDMYDEYPDSCAEHFGNRVSELKSRILRFEEKSELLEYLTSSHCREAVQECRDMLIQDKLKQCG